jgi:hypothetical protein
MLRKIHLLVHDDTQTVYRANPNQHSFSQYINKLYMIVCSQECNKFTFIDVKEKLISLAPIGLNFHTVLKTPDGKEQIHIIGVDQHTDVVENHRYSVDKPNETQWSEMTPLWDTRCHPDILGNSVADSYPSNSPCQVRLNAYGIDRV